MTVTLEIGGAKFGLNFQSQHKFTTPDMVVKFTIEEIKMNWQRNSKSMLRLKY